MDLKVDDDTHIHPQDHWRITLMRSPAEGYIFVTNLSLAEYKTSVINNRRNSCNPHKINIFNIKKNDKNKLYLIYS